MGGLTVSITRQCDSKVLYSSLEIMASPSHKSFDFFSLPSVAMCSLVKSNE